MAYPGEYVGPGSRISPQFGGEYSSAAVRSNASGYVRGAAELCTADRCHLTEGLERLAEAGRLVERLRAEKHVMEQTAALWCDTGHAFSARDRGRKRVTVTVTDEDTGQDVSEIRQVCGRCTITPAVMAEPVLWPPLAIENGAEDGH